MASRSSVFIVTGATGNLGAAILARLADHGASLVAVDRKQETLDAALAGLANRDRHHAHRVADLTDPVSCDEVIAATIARHGRIDGVVHTVGGFAAAPLAQSDGALFESMFRLNVVTTVNLLRAAIAPMRAARHGSLVAIGAGAALKAPGGLAAYAAAKAGVLRLVESFAEELKSERVRVNAILPSIIDTPQNRAAMPDADHASWVPPAKIAETIAFLLGDQASEITGAAIPIVGRV
jgi:NAD(P)-dependent dehydrogenase (short-subunit alcohol dehydrogenase family)